MTETRVPIVQIECLKLMFWQFTLYLLLCVTLYVFSFHACCKEVISVLWLSHPKSTTEFLMSVRGCVRLLHSWQEFAFEVFHISGPATKITQNKQKKLASDISIQSVNTLNCSELDMYYCFQSILESPDIFIK